MHRQKPQFYFLLIILLLALILTYFIFRPFLYALALAIIFATAFQPAYRRVLQYTRGKKGLAALITMFIATVLILIPLTLLGIQIFQEAKQLYIALDTAGTDDVIFLIENKIGGLRETFPALQNISVDINQYLKFGSAWLASNLGSIFSGFAKLAMSLFIFLIALYYFLKDGEKIRNAVITISPLEDSNDRMVLEKLQKSVDSVIRGSLIIAIVQGALAATGFYIFGVPNAILWGSVAAIAAFIPGIGTSLVIVPAIIFLFLAGHTAATGGLIIWGVIVVGLIDNFLAPKLMGRGTEIHPLLILLSVLGGIGFFGPIGFVLGPLVVSLLFALIDIYLYIVKKTEKESPGIGTL